MREKNSLRPKKRKSWLVPLLCYGAALLLWFGLSVFFLARDIQREKAGLLEPKDMLFSDFYADGMITRESPEGGMDLISAAADPKLIYSPGESFYVRRLSFSYRKSNTPGGEMWLYYTTRPGENFSEHRRVAAKQAGDGSWFFDLGGREVTALRLDPTPGGGVLWRNWRITLNSEKPTEAYFLPDARPVFAVLFLPAFASAAVLEGLRLKTDFHLRHKAKDKKKTR